MLDRPIAILTGKGGTGKSTVAVSLARAQAAEGRRTLVVDAESSEHRRAAGIGPLLGANRLTAKPISVSPGLWAATLRPSEALEAFVLRRLPFRPLARAALRTRSIRNTLAFFPGIKEFLLLWRLFDLEEGNEGTGATDARPFERIVWDAPATGTGLFWISIAQTVVEILRRGFFADEARRMMHALSDPERAVVAIVCLPEELSVRETEALARGFAHRLHIDHAPIILNRSLASAEACRVDLVEAWLRKSIPDGSDPVGARLRAALEWARLFERRRDDSVRFGERLSRLGGQVIELPWLFDERNPVALSQRIAGMLRPQITNPQGDQP